MRSRSKPQTMREIYAQTNAWDRFYAASAGMEPLAQKELAPKREIVNRSPADELESAVLRDVRHWLAVYPPVLFAVRQNGGSAWMRGKGGVDVPVKFYDIFRARVPMVISDIWGIQIPGLFALEIKRVGWRFTGTEREIQQAAFLDQVKRAGGRAGFATSCDEARAILEG